MSVQSHLSAIQKYFASKIVESLKYDTNRIKVQVNSQDLLELVEFIRDELKFPSLEAISGLDWESYFEVVYFFDRWDGDPTLIQVHVKINDRDNPSIPSVFHLYTSADWHERELFDLYGVKIENHPNLKRLLLPEEWDEMEHKHISELYPMRRAYKLPEKPYSYKPALK